MGSGYATFISRCINSQSLFGRGCRSGCPSACAVAVTPGRRRYPTFLLTRAQGQQFPMGSGCATFIFRCINSQSPFDMNLRRPRRDRRWHPRRLRGPVCAHSSGFGSSSYMKIGAGPPAAVLAGTGCSIRTPHPGTNPGMGTCMAHRDPALLRMLLCRQGALASARCPSILRRMCRFASSASVWLRCGLQPRALPH